MNNNYDCCSHFKTNTYKKGYIVHPFFKVKICDNCGEVIADGGVIADFILGIIVRFFWDGYVFVKED